MKKSTLLLATLLISIAMSAQHQRMVYSPAKHPVMVAQPAQSGELIRNTLIQDFESYADFSLVFNPWTTNDVDGSTTYGIQDVEFPHAGEPMSYIVFNPASTTPSMSGDAALQPHGGSRFAACFASTTPANNDWIISPQIALGSSGVLKFWVKSYTSQYGLERYKVGISTTTNNPSSFTIISPGAYLEAPAGAWEQKTFDLSAYSGQNIYVGIQCVSNDAFIFMLDDLEVTSQTVTGGTLTGKVTDAINGNPIQNALVSIAGLTDLTDANGNYAITGIPAGALNAEFNATPTSGTAPLAVQFTDLSTEGTQSVTCSATGYTTYTNNQVVIPAGGSLELQISLSPTLAAGQYRVVLTWGEQPLDIDSHLKTPIIEGTAYHIYYQNYGSASTPPYAQLDIDDTESFGPETVTIYQLKPGEYHYYVHNYSQTPAITTSNAVVQVYNENGLMQTFNVPTAGEGLYWDVFKLSGSGVITPVNQIVTAEPGSAPFLTPEQMVKKPAIGPKNIVSWNWTFGDGATSTQQNPNHTYTANGTYTVSLTVSDGTNSNTETRTGYITVTGGSGGTATLTGKVTDAVNGNPVPNALVSIAGLTDLTDANGNYSITGIPAGALKANFTANPTAGTAPLVVQFTDLSAENAHIVTCSATGYTTYSNSQVVIPDGGSLELQISLSPILAAGQYRVVLTWGEQPLDIDSHLKTPVIEGAAYHISYQNFGSAATPPYALLDIDDTESFGPETVTIYQLKPGEYRYYVHNYSTSPEITVSNAVVQIYNESGLLYTFNIPTSGSGLYWDVFKLNGSTGAVTSINQIVANEPGGKDFYIPGKFEKKQVNTKRNVVSWSWNFGDGGVSTEQNPSHKYLNNGSYTVSLTVSDGTANNTETKNAYIVVGPAGTEEPGWEKEVSIFPNPANDKLNINSGVPVHSASLVDMNGNPVIMLTECGKSFSIDAHNLPNGVYILRIITDRGMMVRKVNIQR